MNKYLKIFSVLLPALVFLSGCDKNPLEKLVNPLPDGDVPISSGIYTIYDDEFKTGGGLALIPGGGNQSIDLSDQSSPQMTVNAIRYTWNGQDVDSGGTPQHLFAGFNIIVSPDGSTLASTPARDLSGPGYTKLTMYVRGTLSANTRLRIEGPDDGPGGITAAMTELSSLNSSWTKITLTIPGGDFASIKSFTTISFQYTQPPFTTNPGNGGDVYLDDIRYEQ